MLKQHYIENEVEKEGDRDKKNERRREREDKCTNKQNSRKDVVLLLLGEK